jgi:chromosome segregation ATPase
MDRKLQSDSIDALELYYKSNINNPAKLSILRFELSLRRGTRAKRLLQLIDSRESTSSAPKQNAGVIVREKSHAIANRSPHTNDYAALKRLQDDLPGKLAKLEDELVAHRSVFHKAQQRLSELQRELAEYLGAFGIGYKRTTAEASEKFLDKLEEMTNEIEMLAADRWLKKLDLDKAKKEAEKYQLKINSAIAEIEAIKNKQQAISAQLLRNKLAYSIDHDNALIQEVAERLANNADKLELLIWLKEKGVENPPEFILRGKIFLENVIRKRV